MLVDYFTGATNPHHEDLLKTIQSLQADSDRDVRFFVCKVPDSENDIIPNMVGTLHVTPHIDVKEAVPVHAGH